MVSAWLRVRARRRFHARCGGENSNFAMPMCAEGRLRWGIAFAVMDYGEGYCLTHCHSTQRVNEQICSPGSRKSDPRPLTSSSTALHRRSHSACGCGCGTPQRRNVHSPRSRFGGYRGVPRQSQRQSTRRRPDQNAMKSCVAPFAPRGDPLVACWVG